MDVDNNNNEAAGSKAAKTLDKWLAPLNAWWLGVNARYGKAINVLITLAILGVLVGIIRLLKGYVQFI